METWKILVFIAILAVLYIGAWYVIKFRLEEIESTIFVYPKNGHHYMPLYRCRMKCPASGEWFDAIIYQEYNTEKLYVRDRKDFLDKFIKLKDYKNGNNSKQRVSEVY